jgi:hypothetical protein
VAAGWLAAPKSPADGCEPKREGVAAGVEVAANNPPDAAGVEVACGVLSSLSYWTQ